MARLSAMINQDPGKFVFDSCRAGLGYLKRSGSKSFDPDSSTKAKASQMDNDRLIGSGKQLAGRAKELLGKLVGDAKLQVDGKAEQAEGKVQNAAGGVKDALRK